MSDKFVVFVYDTNAFRSTGLSCPLQPMVMMMTMSIDQHDPSDGMSQYTRKHKQLTLCKQKKKKKKKKKKS